LEVDGFSEIRDAMLENAPRAAAAADAEAEGEGVEWTIVAGKGIEGDDRPLEGGDSEGAFSGGGVGWTYLSMKNFSLERCPDRFANICPKLKKSFSTNTMKPNVNSTSPDNDTFESAIIRIETDLTQRSKLTRPIPSITTMQQNMRMFNMHSLNNLPRPIKNNPKMSQPITLCKEFPTRRERTCISIP
jgi:hypothetical protein